MQLRRKFEKDRLVNAKLKMMKKMVMIKTASQKKTAVMKDPVAVFSAPWLARHFDMNVVVMIRHPGALCDWLPGHRPGRLIHRRPCLGGGPGAGPGLGGLRSGQCLLPG